MEPTDTRKRLEHPIIYVNTRSLGNPLTGVQRYTREITSRLPDLVPVAPGRIASGAAGHLWEQTVLPRRVRDGLLWSPANTGPTTLGRQVITIHDIAPIDHPEWVSRRFARWYGYMLPRVARRAARVVTDSEFTRSRVVERLGVPPERVVAIPIGVDSRFGPEPEGDPAAARAELGLPPGRYVLAVGSLEPRKNIARLLEAWGRAIPSIPGDVTLVVAGGAGGRHIFADATVGPLPPRTVLTGRVPDRVLPALYAGALAFAYPSTYEGFGLPPLEAMASGVPVMAGNGTSIPEVIGDAGLLVDPSDTVALADALIRLTTDPALRGELRARGLARARTFSWDVAADRIRAVLLEAVSAAG